jgi:thioester reductase-like protein
MDKKNILITGATGFVGVHLLAKLIDQADVAEIYLISRNADKNGFLQTYDSIFPILNKYGLTYSKKSIKKIKILYGDISEPYLGIQDELYHSLIEKIDVVYHVAAEVNHLKKYEALKRSNVDCVQDIISFAKNKKKKIINFISTMGAASKRGAHSKFLEDFPDCSANDINISMGYLKSKYEAEKILSKPDIKAYVNIFRLGYISGNTISGIGMYENNQLMLFIKSCTQIGYAPTIDRVINFTPVDFTSEILSSKYFRDNSKRVMHLVNCSQFVTWVEIIDFLNEKGFNIKKIDLASWQTLLKKSGKNNALYRMLLTYRRMDADDHIIKFGKNLDEYNINNVISFCNEMNICFPKIKYDYLSKIFSFLTEVGFLTKKVS